MTELLPSLPLLVTAFLKPDLRRAGPFDLHALRCQNWGSRVIPSSWIQEEKVNGKCPTPQYLNFIEDRVKNEDDLVVAVLLFEGDSFCRTTGSKSSWGCAICGKLQQEPGQELFRDYILLWNPELHFYVLDLQYDKVTQEVIAKDVTRFLDYREVWEVYGPKPFFTVADHAPIDLDYGAADNAVEFLLQSVIKEDRRRRAST